LESTPDPTTRSALLQHAGFVERLAVGLVALTAPHEADDLVQETYLRVLRRRPSGAERLRPWLRRVVQGLATSRRREEHRRRRREESVARSESTDPGPLPVERLELQQAVVQAVLDLPPHYKETIVLRYYRDLSHEEIAAEQGIALETVATRLRRGHALLRTRLERDLGSEATLDHALAPFLPRPTAPVPARTVPGPLTAVALAAAGLTGLLVLARGVGRPGGTSTPAPHALEVTLRATLESVTNEVLCASPVSSSDIELDLRFSVLQELAFTDDGSAGDAPAERTFHRVRQRTVLGGTFARQGVPSAIDRTHEEVGPLEGRMRPVASSRAPDLRLDGLAPGHELAVGDTLAIESGRVAGWLAPPDLFPAAVIASTQELLDGTHRQGPEQWFTPGAGGSGVARVVALGEEDGRRVATLALETRLTDTVDLLDETAPRLVVAVPEVTLDGMGVVSELVAEGTLVWDLEAGRVRSLQLRGALELWIDLEGKVRMRDGEIARLLRHSHLEGLLELDVTVTSSAVPPETR
jgi:RNA polymerase sigma-70 factor (ECF subfamily)